MFGEVSHHTTKFGFVGRRYRIFIPIYFFPFIFIYSYFYLKQKLKYAEWHNVALINFVWKKTLNMCYMSWLKGFELNRSGEQNIFITRYMQLNCVLALSGCVLLFHAVL